MSAATRPAGEQALREAGSEKRSAPRFPASQVPSITGLRLSPHGAEARLVDISTTGLLAECTSRLKVGSSVAVLFEGQFTIPSIVGRIARCSVAAMGRDGVLRYHVGISFNKPIALDVAVPEPPPLQAAEPSATVEPPVQAAAPGAAEVRNRW
jgi:hypothetical protein